MEIESILVLLPPPQIGVDFSKVPRVPGDGAYAPNDEDVEAKAATTKIHITPAPKLKPFQFDSVCAVAPEGSWANTLSPSIIKHSATQSAEPATRSSCSSNHSPGAAADDGREGESDNLIGVRAGVTQYGGIGFPKAFAAETVSCHFRL